MHLHLSRSPEFSCYRELKWHSVRMPGPQNGVSLQMVWPPYPDLTILQKSNVLQSCFSLAGINLAVTSLLRLSRTLITMLC